MKRADETDECGVEFAVGEMRACAHAAAGAIGVVRGAAAFGVREVALWVEDGGGFEVGGVVVCCPGVHIKSSPSRHDSIFIVNILDTSPRKTYRDDGVESKDFSDESGYVRDFFFDEAFLPSVTVGIDAHYFSVGAGLDLLALEGGEVCDAHYQVAGDGVETGGDHG